MIVLVETIYGFIRENGSENSTIEEKSLIL